MCRESLRNALPRVKERQLTCLKIGIPWGRRVRTTRWKVGNLATRIEPDSYTDAAKITFRPPHVFVTTQITSFADPTIPPDSSTHQQFSGTQRTHFRTLFFSSPFLTNKIGIRFRSWKNISISVVSKVSSKASIGNNNFPSYVASDQF